MCRFSHIISIFAVSVLTAFLTACTGNTVRDGGDVLVSVGEAVLSKEELVKQLPAGLSPEDSTALARAYIRSWIDGHLISEIAAQNIGDLSEIDRMAEQYRNDLIAYEYRRRMFDEHARTSFPEDSLKAYYDDHQSDFILQRPVIKGIYLKIPDDSPALKTAKKLYKSTKTDDIDRLEKQCLDDAVHYDYFRDRWIDWEKIESKIPIDFGNDPNSYLYAHKDVEVTQGGFTYLLSISEYIPSGKAMPYEFAREEIMDILVYLHRKDYDRQLRMELLHKAEEEGKISINCKLE